MKAFIQFKKPIVVAINGPALGLGASILPLCDIVWASEKAWFQTPYATIRLTPAGCSSYTFPQILGVALVSLLIPAAHLGPQSTPPLSCGLGRGPSRGWSPRAAPSPCSLQVISAASASRGCCPPVSTQPAQQVDYKVVWTQEPGLLSAAHSLSSGGQMRQALSLWSWPLCSAPFLPALVVTNILTLKRPVSFFHFNHF